MISTATVIDDKNVDKSILGVNHISKKLGEVLITGTARKKHET